jgi:hypothetical protein
LWACACLLDVSYWMLHEDIEGICLK